MAHTLTLYPLPGTFQDRPLTIHVSSRRCTGDSWQEIKSWAKWQFEADADEINLRDIFWGGEYGDDNYREALTVRGEIVGVFDDALTAGEWRDMIAADVAQDEAAKAAAAAEIERKKMVQMYEDVAAIKAAMPACCAVSPVVAAIWGEQTPALKIAAE